MATITTSAFVLLSAPHVASSQAATPTSSRLLLGEAALEIRTGEPGQLQVAIADSTRVLAITVLARDAKRWADSVSLVLRRKVALRRAPREWVVLLEEPGIQAGSLSLTRRDGESGSTWSLFLADRDFEEIRLVLSATEVRAVLAAMQHRTQAALAAIGLPPKRSPRKRPPVPTPKPRS